MRIVVLETDFFPDQHTMDEALASLERAPAGHRLSRHDLRRALNEDEWDAVLDAVLAGDVIVTV
jgi:hypothetical protein